MYSQYMSGAFSPLEGSRPAAPGSARRPPPPSGPSRAGDLLGEVTGGLSRLLGGVLKQFSSDGFDAGDILLVLIILFLFLEGDDLEVVITLGLMLLLGLKGDQPAA